MFIWHRVTIELIDLINTYRSQLLNRYTSGDAFAWILSLTPPEMCPRSHDGFMCRSYAITVVKRLWSVIFSVQSYCPGFLCEKCDVAEPFRTTPERYKSSVPPVWSLLKFSFVSLYFCLSVYLSLPLSHFLSVHSSVVRFICYSSALKVPKNGLDLLGTKKATITELSVTHWSYTAFLATSNVILRRQYKLV